MSTFAFKNMTQEPSNRTVIVRRRDGRNSRPYSWHRWIPAWLVMAHAMIFVLWPTVQDVRALALMPIGLAISYSYWAGVLGLSPGAQTAFSMLLFVILFSLPWFSLLASSLRATVLCTLGVVVLLVMQVLGWQLQRHHTRSTASLPRHSSSPHSHIFSSAL